MNSRKVVCPLDQSLISRLNEREIAIRVDDPALIPMASKIVRESNNRLICVIVDSKEDISNVMFRREWEQIPIALMASSMGRFRNLADKLQLIRELDLRVFLPYSVENLSGIRILSSVGVPSCLLFDDNNIDWDELADLMTYALLESSTHAPIEPFDHILRNYKPDSFTTWGAPFFEGPEQFIHLDLHGQVALSRKDLLDGNFMGSVDDGEPEKIDAAIEEQKIAVRKRFLDNHPCSMCEGFRVCMCKFICGNTNLSGCSAFFSELMLAVEQRRGQDAAAQKPVTIWQL